MSRVSKGWRTIKSPRPAFRRHGIREAINKGNLLTQLEMRMRLKVRNITKRIIRGEQGGSGNIAEYAGKMALLTSDEYRQ